MIAVTSKPNLQRKLQTRTLLFPKKGKILGQDQDQTRKSDREEAKIRCKSHAIGKTRTKTTNISERTGISERIGISEKTGISGVRKAIEDIRTRSVATMMIGSTTSEAIDVMTTIAPRLPITKTKKIEAVTIIALTGVIIDPSLTKIIINIAPVTLTIKLFSLVIIIETRLSYNK